MLEAFKSVSFSRSLATMRIFPNIFIASKRRFHSKCFPCLRQTNTSLHDVVFRDASGVRLMRTDYSLSLTEVRSISYITYCIRFMGSFRFWTPRGPAGTKNTATKTNMLGPRPSAPHVSFIDLCEIDRIRSLLYPE